MHKNKVYKIKEYESFTSNKLAKGYNYIDEKTFDMLENFILSNKNDEVFDIMTISYKKNCGKLITAKNYVGIISMKDGTSIEILPKIYSGEDNEKSLKNLLIDMVRVYVDAPYKLIQKANLDSKKMNIAELFISMFIEELYFVVKCGIKSSYKLVRKNEIRFKGKMIFSENIKRNLIHKERSFNEYYEFNEDRVENRILKTCLLYLYKISMSSKNKRDIRKLLFYFEDVSVSKDYNQDYSKCVIDRNTSHYKMALNLSKVFLSSKSFTSFSGSNVAFCLLFPMESLFEAYVYHLMKKELKRCRVKFQDRSHYLFQKPSRNFAIRPDIVVVDKENEKLVVCDTKWKKLDIKKKNYGISILDMYQLYAYQKKYEADYVMLIYPKVFDCEIENFYSEDSLIKIRMIDMFSPYESIKILCRELEGR